MEVHLFITKFHKWQNFTIPLPPKTLLILNLTLIILRKCKKKKLKIIIIRFEYFRIWLLKFTKFCINFLDFFLNFKIIVVKLKKYYKKKRERKISIWIKMITVINGKLLPLPGSEISEMLTSSWGDIYNPLIGNRRVQFFPLGLMQY